jgi:hypothetical protein
VAVAKTKAATHAAERAVLAACPARLFDFGPPDQQVGMLKGFGLPRRFIPVGKNTLWDAMAGYGFTLPALNEEVRTWINDPLERDACRIEARTTFRFTLPTGPFHLRVSAEPIGAATGEVRVKAAEGEQKKPVGGAAGTLAEFSIAGGGSEPVEVAMGGYGLLRWITAIGEPPSGTRP